MNYTTYSLKAAIRQALDSNTQYNFFNIEQWREEQ